MIVFVCIVLMIVFAFLAILGYHISKLPQDMEE